ncbi:sugar ABC transporter permease [Oscillospiraceae bacterium PP1C4]
MKKPGNRSRLIMGDRSFIFWMLVPSVLVVLVFTYYPLMRGITMAFQNYNLFNINNIKWIGLDNFAKLFDRSPSNMFYNTLANTAKWVIISLVCQFLLGFLMALLLQAAFFGKKIYQAMIFFPWAISGFTIGIMWRWMFNGTAGVINDVLIKLGILETQYGFLSEVGSSFNSVIVANVWYGIPFFTIMITAALQGVPQELYEAADVDGAGALRKFTSITLPHIKPVLVLTILLRVIWIFNFPDLVYSMTGGGPAGSSHIITSYMMEKVRSLDYGMGSAIGLIVILFLSVYTVFYLAVTKFDNMGDI